MNPADVLEISKIVKNAVRAQLLEMRVSLPGRVEKYDPATQKAEVKPLLKRKYFNDLGDEIIKEMSVIPDVPVQFPGSSVDAFLSFPIIAGETLGRIEFMDRSMELWLAGNGAIVDPADDRIHNIADAVFIPGLRPFGSPLAGVSTDCVVLKNGNLIITIDPDGKISVQNNSDDFISLVKDLCEACEAITVMTGIGVQPVINKTIFTTLKAKLEGFVI